MVLVSMAVVGRVVRFRITEDVDVVVGPPMLAMLAEFRGRDEIRHYEGIKTARLSE